MIKENLENSIKKEIKENTEQIGNIEISFSKKKQQTKHTTQKQ